MGRCPSSRSRSLDKYEFCRDHFVPRATAFLNAVRNALINAGVQASRISQVTIPKGVPGIDDYRLVISGTRGARTLEIYVELTDATHLGRMDLRGHAVITLALLANGSPVVTTYVPGTLIRYTNGDIDEEYLARLTAFEGKRDEIIAKAKTALAV